MPVREIPLRCYTIKKPDTLTVWGEKMEEGGENGDVVVG
jgi:hypothetical protein